MSRNPRKWLALVQARIDAARIAVYKRNGFRPWSRGYPQYKNAFLQRALRDERVIGRFASGGPLPPRWGYRLDERAVELPWLYSRLSKGRHHLLDAGSALNFEFLLSMPRLSERTLVIYTLSPETVTRCSTISYIYGDLRDTILKGDLFDEIACISTLEHIGLDNRFLYSREERYRENVQTGYRAALTEFRRLLKPGGRLFVTVPYGRYQHLGWLQQFDAPMIETVIEGFGGAGAAASYFKYMDDGWQRVAAADCADCRYFDIHRGGPFEADYLAAARAVACLELIK